MKADLRVHSPDRRPAKNSLAGLISHNGSRDARVSYTMLHAPSSRWLGGAVRPWHFAVTNTELSKTSIMISEFFVLSPRGDTIIAKQYRNDRGEFGAHERSHTEAFFRKIKFWNDAANDEDEDNLDHDDVAEDGAKLKRTGDAPPVFFMPDGMVYIHVKRNGLIFCCTTARNISPNTVIEVGPISLFKF